MPQQQNFGRSSLRSDYRGHLVPQQQNFRWSSLRSDYGGGILCRKVEIHFLTGKNEYEIPVKNRYANSISQKFHIVNRKLKKFFYIALKASPVQGEVAREA